jgi:hypothetical protein
MTDWKLFQQNRQNEAEARGYEEAWHSAEAAEAMVCSYEEYAFSDEPMTQGALDLKAALLVLMEDPHIGYDEARAALGEGDE